MGLGIALVNYKCDILDRTGDPKNFLHRVLPPANEDSESLLAKIDWYGDTYFNYLQMKQFLAEWDRLAPLAQTPEEKALVASVRNMAIRCQEEREVLRFIGD